MTIRYIVETPIGKCKIIEERGCLLELSLASAGEDLPLCMETEAATQLIEYFSGKRKRFDLPIHAKGTQFQRDVWEQLQKIPYGTTASYDDIAKAIGRPKAARAVGGAVGKNPVAIIIPCHRVIRKNGTMGGFSLGLDAKRILHKVEKITCVKES